MKLERLHESVLKTVAFTAGLSFAIYCGSLAGGGKTGPLATALGGVAAVATLVMLRERVWILIPVLSALGAKIPALPLPFSIRQLAVLFAFGSFLVLKALKIVRFKPTRGVVDLWLFIVLGYLLSVFLRHPVGVEALGAERVGGRPYFDILLACTAYWVLCRAVASPRLGFSLPLLMVGATALDFVINFLAIHFPSTLGFLSQIYAGSFAEGSGEGDPAEPGEDSGRQTYMAGIGGGMAQLAFCFWRPFSVINPFHFYRFAVFAAALYAILVSGFRSALMGMILTFFLSSYFRRGAMEVFRAAVLALVALGFILALQGRVIDLPFGVQRTLSFLPGQWDYAATSAGQGSTEWRTVMWKAMLTGNKYIENKWLGDGFGFTRQQLDIMNAIRLHGTTADQQENLLITGTVHSGPVSAIRYVGYVGLALFLILAGLVARRAVQLIRRSENTPFFPLALFIGIGAVAFPVSFLLIFGQYGDDLANLIVGIGMQQMLENSLEAYEATQKAAAVPVKPPQRIRQPVRFAPVLQPR